MALVFQRLARNFIKNGYFPTDTETLRRVIQALSFPTQPSRILDPCCGEGTAIAEIKHSSNDPEKVTSFGIEYDRERALHSKQLLDVCIHADINDCKVTARQFGLLFLNPPYGDSVADKAQLSDPSANRLRLEKQFYRQTNGLLQFGGVIVLIVPVYSLDKELSSWISTHFTNVQVFMAPEQQFKQCVVFGVRSKVTENGRSPNDVRRVRDHLMSVGAGDVIADDLPWTWAGDHYCVPASGPMGKFEAIRLDPDQLTESLGTRNGVWRQFDQVFAKNPIKAPRRPLCDVSNWHLALLLAAGQISGVVRSRDGRTYVVRGDTYKDKKVDAIHQEDDDGGIQTTVKHTDIFVPAIRALDMTANSETFGEVFTIR